MKSPMARLVVFSAVALALAITPASGLLRGNSTNHNVAAQGHWEWKFIQDAVAANTTPEGGAIDIWGIKTPEGGNPKTADWRADKGGGPAAYAVALAWITMVGSAPIILNRLKGGVMTTVQKVEFVGIYVWLIGGLYLFTSVIVFNSGHFREPRSLALEEAVYLFAQIFTTVGYGDITPAYAQGQLIIGAFVLITITLVVSVVGELQGEFENFMTEALHDEQRVHTPRDQKVSKAFKPVTVTGGVFASCVVIGILFFRFWPGEGKTVFQAIYMSLITLSSVGFGAFTPVTHAGMVFSSFWMVVGVGALGSFCTAYATFVTAVKKVHHEDHLDGYK